MTEQDISSNDEHEQGFKLNSVEALVGQAQAFEHAIVRMMQVISKGMTVEDANQYLVSGLRNDAEMLRKMPGDMGRAAHYQLSRIASMIE